MEVPDSWWKAARELVANSPPPTAESTRELKHRLRVLAARKAALSPDAVAKRESVREIRAEMRRACERYLGGEIRLRTLTGRLRLLEDELRDFQT